MLTIQVGNHLNDKFVSSCHVGYFINGDRRKLTAWHIFVLFTLYGLNFVFLYFSDTFMNELYIKG